MLNKNIIGVSGLAASGKDLFVKLLSERLPNVKRFALADNLKKLVDLEIQKRYGFSIFSCTPEQKEVARPFLVEWARDKRRLHKGRYFIDLLIPEIQEYRRANPNAIICISDIRYDEYENDEVSWIKKENNGILVHIQKYKYDHGKKIFPNPPNEDEARNDPDLIKNANYRIIWQDMSYNSSGGLSQSISLHEYIDEFLKWFNR